ncbi:2-oxo acid dehydrogenase subunit E2 [Candidatus Profftia sp. (ex Adelges kitamiensis)]|uniref:2-oxo acid dehydrogenase subunit E2 n=1 Tax=Candidatus Profftia sp. (ex Adelges kitamiensis) TaxID=2864218 RepID=UPI001CE34023|nr:2-oxo acid dehydrogenase subunit E2 [Candidatus Profftia sp. (ex Adelges kitamiensis)]
MIIKIYVPDVGIQESEINAIMVKIGDTVKVEQSLINIKRDNVYIEIPSPLDGIIKDIKVSVGEQVKTGQLIMTIQSKSLTSTIIKDISIPDIGSDELEVTEVMVKVGDNIQVEQSLITIEGNKVSMEVPAPFAGLVKEIKINVGDQVRTGSLIMTVETTYVKPVHVTTSNTPLARKTMQNIEYFDINSTEIMNDIMVKMSDNLKDQQSVMNTKIEKLKTSSFIQNSKKEKVTSANEFNIKEKQQDALILDKNITFQKECTNYNTYVHATPMIRRMARKFGINLMQVRGSGRKGRILREDIQRYIQYIIKNMTSIPRVSDSSDLSSIWSWPKVDYSKFGATEEVTLSRIQKISGSNLSRNWMMIPHITQFEIADITDVETFRVQENNKTELKKQDIKITILVFLIKAVAKALKEFPYINSCLSDNNQKLIIKKYINIGIAVDTPGGLVVPVLYEVDKKGLVDLSRELILITKKARDGKLTISDIQGGCFTISNLGGIGGIAFTPIINAPEVAILGISKSSMQPIWNGKDFIPRLILPLSFSFDHRVIDGATGARFVAYIATIMSDIRYLIM